VLFFASLQWWYIFLIVTPGFRVGKIFSMLDMHRREEMSVKCRSETLAYHQKYIQPMRAVDILILDLAKPMPRLARRKRRQDRISVSMCLAEPFFLNLGGSLGDGSHAHF